MPAVTAARGSADRSSGARWMDAAEVVQDSSTVAAQRAAIRCRLWPRNRGRSPRRGRARTVARELEMLPPASRSRGPLRDDLRYSLRGRSSRRADASTAQPAQEGGADVRLARYLSNDSRTSSPRCSTTAQPPSYGAQRISEADAFVEPAARRWPRRAPAASCRDRAPSPCGS